MLTNLAYAGGGTNTYSDVMPTGDGTSGTLNNGTSDTSTTYVNAKYYIPAGANPTTAPTEPSTSTNGTGQYGYLYNFCAANGGQTGNGACSNSSSAAVTTTISICPTNWRLPTSNGGEFSALTTAINATSGAAGSTNLRTTWLAQYVGGWGGGFFGQGSYGNYWSSTQDDSDYAYVLSFGSSGVYPSVGNYKYYRRAVRCLVS
jgi:uncharacterized protein (TIGR02145 family)